MLILGFKDYQTQAKNLANALQTDYQEINTHHFPDGESKVTLPAELPDEIIICRSLDHPNSKLIELFLCANVARQQGVKQITLVAPYLCYMRQDIAFHPGEAVSQKIIGHWLGESFDKIMTVDPHLHRISSLSEAIPNAQTITLSATTAMADYLKQQTTAPVLLGPDEESEQWVKQIAELTGLDWVVANKQRHGDHEVEITLPKFDFTHRTVVIVDDIASTGRTLSMTAKALKHYGAQGIECLVTHPLFTDDAEQVMRTAGIDKILSTDSIDHPSNQIQLDILLAEALTNLRLA